MIRYKILPDKRLVLLWFVGEVCVDDCIALLETVRRDPDYSPEYDMLSDARPMTSVPLTEDLHKILGSLPARPEDCAVLPKNANLVSSDVSYGMSRMMEVIGEGRLLRRMKVFRDASKALAWLGHPGETSLLDA